MEDIAAKKINHGLERILKTLDQDFESLINHRASQSILQSSTTVKQAMGLIETSASSLKVLMSEQFQWVISESIIITSASTEELDKIMRSGFKQMHSAAKTYLNKATQFAAKPEQYEHSLQQVQQSINLSLNEVSVEIEAYAAMNQNRGIKGILKTVFGSFSKLWGG